MAVMAKEMSEDQELVAPLSQVICAWPILVEKIPRRLRAMAKRLALKFARLFEMETCVWRASPEELKESLSAVPERPCRVLGLRHWPSQMPAALGFVPELAAEKHPAATAIVADPEIERSPSPEAARPGES
jgi:hypothetical protein